MDFVNAGLPSTAVTTAEFEPALRWILGRLAEIEPDVVAAEAGASPLEPYGEAAVRLLGTPKVTGSNPVWRVAESPGNHGFFFGWVRPGDVVARHRELLEGPRAIVGSDEFATASGEFVKRAELQEALEGCSSSRSGFCDAATTAARSRAPPPTRAWRRVPLPSC